jgi:acetate kinase
MMVLIFNCGSSSVKFQVIEVGASAAPASPERRLARGLVERIGGEAICSFVAPSGETSRHTRTVASHTEAVHCILRWLDAVPGTTSGKTTLQGLEAVGHRIVHGGDRFPVSVLIDDDVITALTALEELAPLHNPPAIKAIQACRAALGPALPMVAAADVEQWLNERSGLLGVSGRSNDMRELLAHTQDEARCRLAVELFCYRARQYLGAYLAVLGGAQALVFSGGIGERSPAIRSRICADMQWCGLHLDATQNGVTIGQEGRISPGDAGLHVYVIPADEEILIARDVAHILQR